MLSVPWWIVPYRIERKSTQVVSEAYAGTCDTQPVLRCSDDTHMTYKAYISDENSDISNVAAVSILSDVASPDVGYDIQTQHKQLRKYQLCYSTQYY